MSKQTNRRASQRAARKAARNNQTTESAVTTTLTAAATAGSHQPPTALNANQPQMLPNADPSRPLSDLRLNANRENAQKSTGPTTLEGRSLSSRNALKHGLTGNTILLASDDADAYQSRLDAHVEEFQPVTFEERRLVQSIHDSAWRLDRILSLESTIYAKGRIELELCFEDLPPEQRKNFIELETATRYAKDLRNLHIQESRLQRQRTKDIQTLTDLIAKRQAKAEAEPEAEEAAEATTPAPKPELGFEFSKARIDLHSPVFPPAETKSFSKPEPSLDHEGGRI